MELMDFGTKLRNLREANNLTQRQLAKMAGIRVSALKKYEAGISHPEKREIYYNLAFALGVNRWVLLNRSEEFFISATEKYGKRGQMQAIYMRRQMQQKVCLERMHREAREMYCKGA